MTTSNSNKQQSKLNNNKKFKQAAKETLQQQWMHQNHPKY
jgi:hypothetical protein